MQHKLLNKALFFEYLTIAWNILEGIICIVIGFLSGSVALLAYGLESGIEVFASGVVVWDLKGGKKTREKIALRLIGAAYFIVSVYIFIDALISLYLQKHPDKSITGIVFILLTAIIMFVLGFTKNNIGMQMKSETVLADAKFTIIDGGLAVTVLIGLVLNLLFGWWWADQVMALFLAVAAFREGIQEFI